MSDVIDGGGGDPVDAPVADAVAPEPAAPVAPAFDPQASYQQLHGAYQASQQELAQFRREQSENQKAFAEYTKQRDAQFAETQNVMRKLFDPEGAKKAAEPKHVTAEDFQKWQQSFMQQSHQAQAAFAQQQKVEAIRQQGEQEMRIVQEKYPGLDEDDRNDLIDRWSRPSNHDKSLLDLAKAMNERNSKRFQSQQAAYVESKKPGAPGGVIKPLPNGKAPPPSAGDSKLKGFAKLRAKFDATKLQ